MYLIRKKKNQFYYNSQKMYIVFVLSFLIFTSSSSKPPSESSYQSYFPEDKPDTLPNGLYISDPSILGLKYGRAMVPLKHIEYSLEVVNSLAHITLKQEYVNPSDKFLNVYFSFPMNPKSVIYKMVAQFGNKIVQGIVKQKEQARKEFQEAKSQGKQVVLTEIDSKSKDIIQMNIGNIPPETKLIISISFVQEMTLSVSTFYRIQIPSTISPRYMNSVPNFEAKMGKLDTSLPIDPDTKISKTNGFTWNFNLILKTYREVALYKSTTHKLKILFENENKKEFMFRLEEDALPNKDFVFLYTTQNFEKPSYVIGQNQKSSVVLVSFIPKFSHLKNGDQAYKYAEADKNIEVDLRTVKGEFIFIVDRSGSMNSASRIGKVREALAICLKSLPTNSYFNLINFGNDFKPMFNQSKIFSNNQINEAIYQIQKMEADYGGTQIYQPLDFVLSQPQIKGYPRFVFLFTDGQVSDTEAVIRMVRRKSRNTRVSSIGIGNGASFALIEGTAQAGKGKYIMLSDDENPTQKIKDLLNSAYTPLITQFSLKYDKQIIESIIPNPKKVPFILKDDPANFYLMFKQKINRQIKIILEYQDSVINKVYQEQIIINPRKQSFNFVDKMARFKVLRTLQILADMKNDQKGQMSDYLVYNKYDKKNPFKKEAILYSVQHQILSEYTSFIAIVKQMSYEEKNAYKLVGSQSIQIAQPVSVDYSYSYSGVNEFFLSFKWYWCIIFFIWMWENNSNGKLSLQKLVL